MKIIQILPTMSFGDAVSNDAAAIRQMLSDRGYETATYASNIDPRLPEGSVLHWRKMKDVRADDLVIFHGSTGDPLSRVIPGIRSRKMMIYHNITPSRFFRGYSQQAQELTESGYVQIKGLAGQFQYCVADSDYNRRDLREMGYECEIDVCPIMIPFEDYAREPDRNVLEKYRGDGWTNLLFVGRIAPNKKQEDIILAFWYYHRNFNPKSRLFLVGNDAGMERYRYQLDNYIRALGLSDAVVFPGHISFAGLLAYYRLADVFVCMSEHEGFCVPLVEAMYFGVPVVAYSAAAVPETLGNGGLLLDRKDPVLAAAAVDRIVRDGALRELLAGEQRRKLEEYDNKNVRERMLSCLNKVIA